MLLPLLPGREITEGLQLSAPLESSDGGSGSRQDQIRRKLGLVFDESQAPIVAGQAYELLLVRTAQ